MEKGAGAGGWSSLVLAAGGVGRGAGLVPLVAGPLVLPVVVVRPPVVPPLFCVNMVGACIQKKKMVK